MKRPLFFRRRQVWFPTLWGWLGLVALAAAALILVARNLHGYLAVSKAVAAPVLIVEGWMGPEELEETAAVVRHGGYTRVITTGGPIVRWPPAPGHDSFAEQAAWYLAQQGVPPQALTAVAAARVSHDRTYLSAVTVRDWAAHRGVKLDAFDVISEGPHARRTWVLYRRVFPDARVGIIATRSYDYDAAQWWRSSIGAKNVIDQTLGLLWVTCCSSGGE